LEKLSVEKQEKTKSKEATWIPDKTNNV
jgi:hypothetical protein